MFLIQQKSSRKQSWKFKCEATSKGSFKSSLNFTLCPFRRNTRSGSKLLIIYKEFRSLHNQAQQECDNKTVDLFFPSLTDLFCFFLLLRYYHVNESLSSAPFHEYMHCSLTYHLHCSSNISSWAWNVCVEMLMKVFGKRAARYKMIHHGTRHHACYTDNQDFWL